VPVVKVSFSDFGLATAWVGQGVVLQKPNSYRRSFSRAKVRSFISVLAFFALVLGLSACAAPQELMVLIDRDRVDEAWVKAYNTGGTLGYERGFHDDENKVVEYTKIEMDGDPFPAMFFIKLELDITDEACVLWIYGMDKDIAHDDAQVLFDMQEIAKRVEACCSEKSDEEVASTTELNRDTNL
jgi:hypothetical protein